MTEISIVVPIHNENENIKPFLQRTEKVLNKMEKSYEIIFALDPSSDNTEETLGKENKGYESEGWDMVGRFLYNLLTQFLSKIQVCSFDAYPRLNNAMSVKYIS